MNCTLTAIATSHAVGFPVKIEARRIATTVPVPICCSRFHPLGQLNSRNIANVPTRKHSVNVRTMRKGQALGRSRRSQITRATQNEDDYVEPPAGSGSGMTVENARAILGVPEEATFDQIMRAKNKLLENKPDDSGLEQIDAAYDMLLMQSFNKRKSGQVENKSIRYADVVKEKPAYQKQLESFSQKASNAVPSPSIGIQVSRDQDLMIEGAVFGVLATWALAQGFLGQADGRLNVPGTQLALAFGASLYFLRDHKRLTMGKSVLLTMGGLVAGGLAGQLLQSWLRVDILPLGGLSSPEALVSEFGILGLWAACTLLA